MCPPLPTVSLENVLLDVKELGRGMELIRRECSLHESAVLRSFLSASEGRLEQLQRDSRTAEVGARGNWGGVGVSVVHRGARNTGALWGWLAHTCASPHPVTGTRPAGRLQHGRALLWREP